jgi:predicted aldo/keto reductase-like oxidoreductase
MPLTGASTTSTRLTHTTAARASAFRRARCETAIAGACAATKLPCWKVETAADFDRLLDEQLERLQIGPIDFYLLHGLDAESWHKMRDLGVLAWAESAMADGRLGHLGFCSR